MGQLILRKIIQIVATRCHILRLKCTKFESGWALPQTPLGELIQRYPRAQTPLSASEMTYIMSGGALNLYSLTHSLQTS